MKVKLESTITTITMENDILKKEKSTMEKLLYEKDKEIKELKAKYMSKSEGLYIEDTHGSIQETTEAIKLKEELEKKNADIVELNMKINLLKSEIGREKKEITSFKGTETLLNSIKELQDELLHVKEQADIKSTKLCQEISELKKQLNTKDQFYKLLQEENSRLKSELKEYKELLTKSEETIKELEKEKTMEVSTNSEDLKELLKKVKEENMRLKYDITAKSQQLASKQSIIDDIKVLYRLI